MMAGMGRPRSESAKRTQIQVRLSEEEATQLEELGASLAAPGIDLPRAEVFRWLLREEVKRRAEKAPKKGAKR